MDEMQTTFRGNLWIRIRTLIFGLLGAAFLASISSGFVGNGFAAALGVVVFLVIGYIVLFYDDIEIIIDHETFTMRRRNKELYRFNLDSAEIFSNYQKKRPGAGCLLTIIPKGEKRIMIDCSVLGKKQFFRLLAMLNEDVKD